jgi:hypothetical protein
VTARKKNNYFFSALAGGALLLLAGCAQQDAALLVTMSGPFNIPQNADKLTIDVFDGSTVVKHKDWCATPTAGCDPLPAQTALSGTVTLVQSGGSHQHVKINAQLHKGTALVGAGTSSADFASGRTVDVALALNPL